MTEQSDAGPASAVRLRWPRSIVAMAACVVPVAVLLWSGHALAPRLGPQIATHWGGSSVPNGFQSTWPSFVGFLVASVVLAGFGVAAVAVTPHRARARMPAAVAAVLAGAAAFGWIVGAWATAAAGGDAHEAVLGWRMVLLVGPLLLGAIVYLVLPASTAVSRRSFPVPELAVAEGDSPTWSGILGSRVLAGLGLILVVVAAALLAARARAADSVPLSLVIVLALAALLVLGMSRVRLTVDQRGVRLSSAIFGVPLVWVRLANIAGVSAEEISPAQWGGWGLRVSSAGVAFVTRRGPGLVVTRRRGGALAVTMDSPEAPAAVAAALVRLHDPSH